MSGKVAKIRDIILDGDISDSFINNILVFFGTYSLVTVSCLIMCRDADYSNLEKFMEEVFPIIVDAIIPTTATFCISILIQNLGTIATYKINRCSMTVISLILTLLYIMMYSVFRDAVNSLLNCLFLVVSTCTIIISSFVSINQLNTNRKESTQSDPHLSG